MPLTRQQVREVDRLAIEELGIPGIVLMENASRGAAEGILSLLADQAGVELAAARAAVLCGGGNNGGDGYAIARHLHNAGVAVSVYSTKADDQILGDAAVNYSIICRMGIQVNPITSVPQVKLHGEQWGAYDVLVDALLGTGFHGSVRQPVASVIAYCNAVSAKVGGPQVVAVDVPSGLDCDTGQPADPTIRADLTVTFVEAKVGFTDAAAGPYLGRVIVADIGIPPQLIEQVKGT